MSWFSFKPKNKQNREKELQEKMLFSQRALLLAASETADAANDVTHLLKNKLTDSLKQIETTAEILPDALIICSQDGIIETMNTAAERIFQWSKKEVTARSITEMFRNKEGEDIMILEFLDKTYACNETQYEQTAMNCLRGKRKSGELFWVELSVRPLPRVSETAMVILCRDATIRMDLRKRLEDNEMNFRSVFESSTDGLVVLGDGGVVTSCNSAFSNMVDLEVENIVATPLVEYFREDQKNIVNAVQDVQPGQVMVVSINSKDSLMTVSPIKWGGSPSLLLTFKDLSFVND